MGKIETNVNTSFKLISFMGSFIVNSVRNRNIRISHIMHWCNLYYIFWQIILFMKHVYINIMLIWIKRKIYFRLLKYKLAHLFLRVVSDSLLLSHENSQLGRHLSEKNICNLNRSISQYFSVSNYKGLLTGTFWLLNIFSHYILMIIL